MRKSKVKGQRSMSAKIVSYGFPLTTAEQSKLETVKMMGDRDKINAISWV